MNKLLMTAEDWNEFRDYGILDYDGFRNDDGMIKEMDEEEFFERAIHATCNLKKSMAARDSFKERCARRIPRSADFLNAQY